MELPRGYISWSQIRLYLESPEEYYFRYILGLPQEVSKPMELGSIFSSAYEDEQYDYRTALMEKNFMPTYAQSIAKAFSTKTIERFPKAYCEYELRITDPVTGVPILARLDAYKTRKYIVENKTGAAWNQQRADTDGQLTFYVYVVWLATNMVLPVRLQHVNLDTGKVTVRHTKRTHAQILDMRDLTATVAEKISQGVWSN